MVKQCTACSLTKPLDAFGRRTSARDGRRSECKDCQREVNRAYQRANRDKVNGWCATYRAKNPDAHRSWRAANPEKFKAGLMRRRARKRSTIVIPYTTAEFVAVVGRKKDSSCAYCGGPAQHLDHVVPLALGGIDGIANYAWACEPCNLSKGARLVADWRPALAPMFPGAHWYDVDLDPEDVAAMFAA